MAELGELALTVTAPALLVLVGWEDSRSFPEEDGSQPGRGNEVRGDYQGTRHQSEAGTAAD
jgi:hypothetical protein